MYHSTKKARACVKAQASLWIEAVDQSCFNGLVTATSAAAATVMVIVVVAVSGMMRPMRMPPCCMMCGIIGVNNIFVI